MLNLRRLINCRGRKLRLITVDDEQNWIPTIGVWLAKMSSLPPSPPGPTMAKTLIAVVQMTSTENKGHNYSFCESAIKEAGGKGCKMVFLPECFDMICDSRKATLANVEPISGPLISKYCQLAKANGLWLSLGGLHEQSSRGTESGKATNAHIVIDDQGQIASVYRKVHLFNLEIPGVVRLIESEFSVAGDRIEEPVETPCGRVGLGICYDVRFAEFAVSLAKSGADILTYPSSFTVPTGMAHWEPLLRARAIETQCYVVAAAQIGTHNAKRSSYGHAMVIDPWGFVIAQCSDKPGFAIAEIDLNYLQEVRKKLPVWSDRRPEIYGSILSASGKSEIDVQNEYIFGHAKVPNFCVFHKTKLSYAFVNHRPVLPGHVLVSPLRTAKRVSDLTASEAADLFALVQKVQEAVEKEYETKSSTIAIQDGIDAGQSVEHVHVHLVPRRATDFGGEVDRIYSEMQKHDKKPGAIRTTDEMTSDANRLRKYFE